MKNIVIINRKGGVGKTLIADELAYAFERMNIPYNLYDLDGQGGITHQPQENENAIVSIVDTPGALQETGGEWIDEADLVIIPTRPTLSDVPATQTTIELAKQHSAGNKLLYVINGFNRFKAAKEFLDWFKDEYKDEIVLTIPQSEAFVQAKLNNQSVADYDSKCPAAVAMNDLAIIVKKVLDLKPVI